MSTTAAIDQFIGHELVDTEGDKIGKVTDVYLDDVTGEPAWATVKTGHFGAKSTFVPLAGVDATGDDLVSTWSKEVVKGAPNIGDDDYLSPEEEERLYAYYGMGSDDPQVVTDEPATAPQATGDTVLTRSEEELRVGTRTSESGRVRLRKYVVTEQVQTTVPVSHEEVRVVREPIADGEPGGEIGEAETEVVLHEEQPVVGKVVVPKERVRLATETVDGQAEVRDEVRKEQIDHETD